MQLDLTRSDNVTPAAFRRILPDTFRMPFTEEDLATLVERYRDGEQQVSASRSTVWGKLLVPAVVNSLKLRG